MKKKLNKIVSIACEESEKEAIVSRIREYLVGKQDYIDGYISIDSSRFEMVDVIIYEGCSNIQELTRILTS